MRRVDLIVTELAVIEPTDAGLVLRETTPRVSVEQAVRATAARLLVPETVGTNARVAALRSRAGRCSQAPQGRDRDRP